METNKENKHLTAVKIKKEALIELRTIQNACEQAIKRIMDLGKDKE